MSRALDEHEGGVLADGLGEAVSMRGRRHAVVGALDDEHGARDPLCQQAELVRVGAVAPE